MKIDLNNSLTNLLPPDKGVKHVSSSDTAATQSATQDRTTFHSDSLSVQSLTSQAMNTPEVRQDKVDTFSQAVKSGTYKLDATAIASAISENKGE